MKKKLPLLLFLLILGAAIGFGVFYHFSTKTKFNQSYVNGNTAGNLYNSGLVCENGDTIFFANPSDEFRLYSMDKDGSNLKKISDDVASFINADEHYVYYVRNNPRSDTQFSFLQINTDSLCRINRNGKGSILILDSAPSLYASLVGNYVYYLHYDKTDATSLYRVKIDGSEKEQVSKKAYYTCSASGQYIYYNGLQEDHSIRRLNTVTGTESIVSESNGWMPTVIGDAAAYFMDCDNDYRIARTDLSDNSTILLTEKRVDCYNVSGDYIYFQQNEEDAHGLCRIRTDGLGYEVLAEGIYTDINTTSDYVYFRDYNSGITYRLSTNAPSTPEIFHPGKEN